MNYRGRIHAHRPDQCPVGPGLGLHPGCPSSQASPTTTFRGRIQIYRPDQCPVRFGSTCKPGHSPARFISGLQAGLQSDQAASPLTVPPCRYPVTPAYSAGDRTTEGNKGGRVPRNAPHSGTSPHRPALNSLSASNFLSFHFHHLAQPLNKKKTRAQRTRLPVLLAGKLQGNLTPKRCRGLIKEKKKREKEGRREEKSGKSKTSNNEGQRQRNPSL
jgi:hypothetical protein